MGFFKKLFKGVKKVFKKIGSGIKKAVGKVGKFMGKLGIVGQIGLGLLLPGIGSMMGTMFGKLATSMMGSTFGLVKGAGHVINAAVNIGTRAGSMFSSITEGVTKVIGDLTGATLNKLGFTKIGSIDISTKTFSGAWDTAQEAFFDVAKKGGDLFSMDTLTAENVFSVTADAKAALAGTDTGSTFSDAILEDLPETIQPYKDPLAAAQKTAIEQETRLPFFGSMPDVAAQEIVTEQETTRLPFFGSMPDVAAATPVSQPQSSLLARAKTGAIERTRAAIAGAPEQLVKTGIANIAAIPRDIVKSAFAPTPEVTYNVRQSAIPDIGFAGIGQEFAQPAFDPISFLDQNQAIFNQKPFGLGAALYGEATYARNMQGYGFQTPMYGMS